MIRLKEVTPKSQYLNNASAARLTRIPGRYQPFLAEKKVRRESASRTGKNCQEIIQKQSNGEEDQNESVTGEGHNRLFPILCRYPFGRLSQFGK